MSANGRFEGRTVAVTGAGGFIGSALARGLIGAGADVVGLDLTPAAAARIESAGARFVRADVTDRPALERALEDIELAIHAAAYVHEWGQMEEFVRVNVGGTVALLDAAEAAGLKRVVHISSVVIYGYDEPGEQDEAAFRRACGIPYIDTKSSSDRIACDRGAVVVRPGDVYGPTGAQWVLRPALMAVAGRLAVPGRGEGLMLPVYVDDLVEAVLAALERGRPGTPYTVWSGETVTFGEYFDRIARIAGRERARRLPRPLLALAGAGMEAIARLLRRDPTFTARAVTFVERRGTASNRRARNELGWAPQVDLDEGLRRCERWLEEEGVPAGRQHA